MEAEKITEDTWMARYAAGDKDAFRRLFAQLAPGLRAFFLRSFRDHALADDLVQSTFLKLHRARTSYRPELPVRPWIFTIAAGVRRDELRRRYRLPRHVGEDEWERMESQLSTEPTAAQDETDAVAAVRSALDRLPESHRIVIHLHRYEGMTFEQIAAVLSTTPGAVRTRACRAYERLREALQPLAAGSPKSEVMP